MSTSLSLRLRVFLFFLFLAVAGIAIVAGAIFVGYRRTAEGGSASGFLITGIISVFGLLGLSAGIWLLFDENVAKPIERLAAAMRTRAHAGVDVKVDAEQSRYLGDLGPAAQAVAGQLSQSTLDAAEAVAAETAHLAAEKERLTALLTEIPIAMVLVSPAHQITLYDGQAAQVLEQISAPRLNASIFDYFHKEDVLDAHSRLSDDNAEVSFTAREAHGETTYDIRLKLLGHAPGYLLLVDDTHPSINAETARPLVYDFSLTDHPTEQTVDDTPLEALTYTVFDTETTGLDPETDEVLQLGAVRVVNGRIVPGEVIDQLINPGVAIPVASSKVHGITDPMVADAPDMHVAAHQFHLFARNSILVAHNAPFDMAFLKRNGKASGLVWDHPVLDTVLLSAVLFGASETHTLDALCDRLDVAIPTDRRHTALGDAEMTANVICRMLPMLASRGYETFGEVVAQTRKYGRLLQDLNA